MIRFYTDINTQISNYCLLNIKQYNSPKKANKKIIYIDPGVYELKVSTEYSKISLLHELAVGKLQENEWISIDYPPDMNESCSDLFIEKSIKNNIRYRDNPKYICTIQSRVQDIRDFVRQYEYLEEQIDFSTKIIGIGNLCRIMSPNSFTDNVFEFLLHKKRYVYHFYGLSLKLIKKYLPKFPNCSVDSTKWTRACTNSLKHKFGLNCKKSTRNMYFMEYMNVIRKSGINIEY